MSERYPLISQLVEENRIPEFDNLYLDMNGIIHNCSHPNDGDAHFRMTEADMFLAIFSYIEHIFTKIKPQKLFFLAIDGVAPRAKMNQQRSRRFRTAQEAKELKDKAKARGEELPEEDAFDSNCITPGTPFMARLSEQLSYFLVKKVSEDSLWRNVEIVLSGHDVPGEGEHKIMEYIRHAKAQPGYNKNVRHCLYGLDADLIMLGLLSHDPHFALLREEVSFGPSRKKKTSLETQNFYLLHLSLFREYLDLEFQNLRNILPFDYSLEHIIDDFILLNIFVGNDFLPHLPGLHINEGALNMLFQIYQKILPQAGGYINENGCLRTDRLSLVLDELKKFEMEQLKEQLSDVSWAKEKKKKSNKVKVKSQAAIVLTPVQRGLFEKVKAFVVALQKSPKEAAQEIFLPSAVNASDRSLLERLANDLGLEISFDEYDPEADAPAIAISRPSAFNDEDDSEDEESMEAINRVLSRYESAKTDDSTVNEANEEEEHEILLQKRIDQIKREYYHEKLGIDYTNEEQMHKLAFRYVEGLQWVLHYYYDGVASWGWFYDYHYSPMISDLKHVQDMKFEFQLGKPFRPFDQLMGVLPSLSNSLIPPAFRDLMTDPASPIIDFYPSRFEADFNGKKASWEAVVKIPFIDQDRLLSALDKRQGLLSAEEKSRNGFGNSLRLTYNEAQDTFYGSSLPGVFPDILHCKALVEHFQLPTLDGLHLVKGLCDGVGLGVRALAGFPSIKTLPHFGHLDFHGVNIFNSDSKNESIIVHVENTFEGAKTEEIADSYIGERTFVNWPFLTESIVMAVSDELFKYEAKVDKNGNQTIVRTPHESFEVGDWKRKAEKIEQHYSKRYGVLIGEVDVILHVRPLKGLKRMENGSFLKEYVGPNQETNEAIQVSVKNVVNEDNRYLERPPLSLPVEFPERTKIFYLGNHAYGCPASVVAVSNKEIAIELISLGNQTRENELLAKLVQNRTPDKYYPSYEISKRLKISGLALSKITSSMLIESDDTRTNIGLNLKFEAKGQKVLGYSRRSADGWQFSEKTLSLLQEYRTRFPEVIQKLMADPSKDFRAARDFFGENSTQRMKEMKEWIKSTGIRQLEAVPLFAEQLDTQTVQAIEHFVAQVAAHNANKVRRLMLRGIPRSALLKPSHAPYRLTSQHFQLGDRVVCVSDSGSVPLSARGVVVGINSSNLDVVFDAPFLAGTTLDGRCGAYKGATVPFLSFLNLSNPQIVCTDASKSTGSSENTVVQQSALQRTLAEDALHHQQKSRKIGAQKSANQQSYRPPSAFKPAKATGPAVGSRNAGLVALGHHSSTHKVDGNVNFSQVTSGAARPKPSQADGLNPHLAALNINGSGRGLGQNGLPTRGGPPSHGGLPTRGGLNGHVPSAPRGTGRGAARPGRGRGTVPHAGA